MVETLRIGELARRSGVGVETVRFYERRGLLPDPPRSRSGYRCYPAATVSRIRFIRRAKELGFSLAEIDELLNLRAAPGDACEHVRARAEAKIADIDERIASLRRMRSALDRLRAACLERRGTSGDCPILGALDGAG